MELGRPVEIASVHIRFLPRPGLELSDFAIHDSAQFGTEPLLRSAEVTAWLRVSSLLKRRVEISSLSLSGASLNLARDRDGRWNIEELLERTARSSTAPTASARKEPRREFPYIEADHARVNFKNGMEKTHFALTNAEFALWQETEDEWGMRLRASPIRTDANLTDTGVVSLNGSWRRSAALEDTPIRIAVEWKQAQIGQISKLVSGSDRGWRGSVLLSGTLSGTLAKSMISANVSVDQLRRDDIFTDGNLRIVARCAAEYESAQKFLTDVACETPAGDGLLQLKGNTVGFPFSSYDLKLLAKDVPAQSVLGLARHVNQAIPADLGASGIINMTLLLSRANLSRPPQLAGEGEVQDVRLSSVSKGTGLALGKIPLRVMGSTSTNRGGSGAGSTPVASHELQIGPINVPLGRPAPVQAQFSLSRAGTKGFIRGEAGLKTLLAAASVVRIPVPPVAAEGSATVNLALSHEWGSPIPAITGTARLHNARAQVRGLNSPLELHRADLAIGSESVQVTNAEASVGATTWRGSLLIPRPCSAPDSCAFEFHLRSPQVSAASLNQLLNPALAKRPWYSLLGLSSSSNSFFAKATAHGSIAIDKLILGSVAGDRFSGTLDLQRGKLSLSRVRGGILDGAAKGTWSADFTVRPPAYSGDGSFDGISLAAIARLAGGEWADGSASSNYQFTSSGWNLHEVMQAAELSAGFDVDEVNFAHVFLNEKSGPLHASLFSGQLTLHQGSLVFENAELDSSSGVFNVSGTATISGDLNLKMTAENSNGYNLSGTLAETRVSPITNQPTQAALKP